MFHEARSESSRLKFRYESPDSDARRLSGSCQYLSSILLDLLSTRCHAGHLISHAGEQAKAHCFAEVIA